MWASIRYKYGFQAYSVKEFKKFILISHILHAHALIKGFVLSRTAPYQTVQTIYSRFSTALHRTEPFSAVLDRIEPFSTVLNRNNAKKENESRYWELSVTRHRSPRNRNIKTKRVKH